MSDGHQAIVNARMLKWARENSGLTLEEAAKSYLNPEKLKKAEDGEERLTFKQFLKIANRYKRPPGFFYLKEPPKEKLIRDFRTLDTKKVKYTPKLRDEIKKVQRKRDFAVKSKIYDSIYNYSYISSVDLESEPESIGDLILEKLNITMNDRSKWHNNYDAFNLWKAKLENIGILIFQISGINIKEMRGFSISDLPYPTIVLNRSDSPLGRIFTLIHEFCHLLLNKGGICTTTKAAEEQFKIERFCNATAGAALVPKEILLNLISQKYPKNGNKSWTKEELIDLKKFFWASNEVILRRLLIFEKTTHNFYNRKRREWKKLSKPKGKGGPPPYKKVISGNSKNYINIVLNAFYDKKITAHQLSYYLDMNLKHLDKLKKSF